MAEAPSPSPSPPPLGPTLGFNGMVIGAAMVCALLCALGLNSMLQCVFQCTHRVVTQPVAWIASRRNNTGLKKKQMRALPTSTYEINNNSSACDAAAGCVICLADFMVGDKLRELPKCNHKYHLACIDKWLLSHSSCPTCRRHLLISSSSSAPSPSHLQIVTTL